MNSNVYLTLLPHATINLTLFLPSVAVTGWPCRTSRARTAGLTALTPRATLIGARGSLQGEDIRVS